MLKIDAGLFQVFSGFVYACAFMENELGPIPKALKAHQSSWAIRIRVAPSLHAVVVGIGYEATPELGHLVIIEADEVAGDGPA